MQLEVIKKFVFGFSLCSILFSACYTHKQLAYDDTYYLVSDELHSGYINGNGKLVIPMQFDPIRSLNMTTPIQCSESFYVGSNAVVVKNGKCGIINSDGAVIIPTVYDELELDDSFFVARKGTKWGVIDLQNRTVFPFVFTNNYFLSKSLGLSSGVVDGMAYLLDYSNFSIISTPYTYIAPFFDGYAEVEYQGKSGFITAAGELVVNPQFSSAFGYAYGLAAVEKDGLYGYIDTAGRLVIPHQFDLTFGFQKCDDTIQAVVRKAGKYGVIDAKGNFIIKPIFTDLRDRYGTYREAAIADSNGTQKWGLIDSRGNWIIKPNYESINYWYDYMTVSKNGLYGVIRVSDHKTIIPFIYSHLEYFKYDGLTLFEKQKGLGKSSWGYLNNKGKVIWQHTVE